MYVLIVFYICMILFFGLMCVSEFFFIVLLMIVILLMSVGFVKVVCCVVRWFFWCVVYELKFFFGRFIFVRYLLVVLFGRIVFDGDRWLVVMLLLSIVSGCMFFSVCLLVRVFF